MTFKINTHYFTINILQQINLNRLTCHSINHYDTQTLLFQYWNWVNTTKMLQLDLLYKNGEEIIKLTIQW